MFDRFTFESSQPGCFRLGIGVYTGDCGYCEVYHRDMYLYLGWVIVVISLGQPL